MEKKLLIKENIPQPLINRTYNECYSDNSFNQISNIQYEYINTGINKWVGPNYINEYMKLQSNIDLGEKTKQNNCNVIQKSNLKNLPQNITSETILLSTDNINLMSSCEFTNNRNPLSGAYCLETMQNLNESNTIHISNFEKGYLFAFTILVVGVLYKANQKLIYKN